MCVCVKTNHKWCDCMCEDGLGSWTYMLQASPNSGWTAYAAAQTTRTNLLRPEER